MPTPYQAIFTGGTANSNTKTITTQDSAHANKQLTLTFNTACPGTGIDVAAATSVRLAAACYSAVALAVQNNHPVRLDGTQSGNSLRAVLHTILP